MPCPELPSGPPEEDLAGARTDFGRLMGGSEDGGSVESAARMEMHRLDEEVRRAGDVETAVKALTSLFPRGNGEHAAAADDVENSNVRWHSCLLLNRLLF